MLKTLVKGLTDFVLGSGESAWNLYTIQQNFSKYSTLQQYPYLSYWPEILYFNSHFWKELKAIHALTLKDEHERKISVFFADGELVLTKHIRGERSRVVDPGQKVAVRYVPQPGTQYYMKEVVVNGQVYSSRSVYYTDIPQKIEVSYLFNIHTHPPHYYNGSGRAEDRYYSFFSLIDVKSFLQSPAAVTGVITDRLWVIAKSASSPSTIVDYDEHKISPENLYQDFAFAVYQGHFAHGRLVRMFPEGTP